MTHALTVLQLDTDFPRIPGDVGCPETYLQPVEIIRIDKATVKEIVSDRPDLIDIAPFATALSAAKSDLVVTSCGFLSYWQNHLAGRTNKTFISSALIGLKQLSQRYAPGEVLIVTFDDRQLTPDHLGNFRTYAQGIVGLPHDMHLRRVIARNERRLNPEIAGRALVEIVAARQGRQHKHILLECTNLPPYKTMLKAATGLPVTDILTLIEAAKPGLVQTDFLT